VDQFDEPPADSRPGRGLTEYVLRAGEPLLAPLPVFSALLEHGEVELVGAPSIDWMGVPLKLSGQVIGVMVAQSYKEDISFNLDDLSLFEFVSTQVALMIDRKRTEQKIRYLGIHDALTGLYNRAYFDEELKRLEHGRLFPISILMADLDNLKGTNDREGHATGDDLLRQTARILRSAFRMEDVVARIGGDEFAVLLPGIDAVSACSAVRRIKESIAQQNARNEGTPLRISIGISTADKGSVLLDSFKKADDQMYAEKHGKK
jgi:diguanylate cyclase (GGDEF)-like protein